jgi:Domain of unknown function (DUF4124)
MKFIPSALSTLLPAVVAALSVFVSMSAMAQYMWLDDAGRKVFSDQPPPATVPAKRILQQPAKVAEKLPNPANQDNSDDEDRPTNAATEATTAKKTAAQPKVAPKTAAGKDKGLEEAKKKIEDEDAAKKKAEQAALDAARAGNCTRAKQAKTTLDSGVRLNQYNAKGERIFMDEAARMVEAKRLEGIIAADCKVN